MSLSPVECCPISSTARRFARISAPLPSSAMKMPTGKVRGAIATLVDISSHKEAERSQERLLHELQHCVKNILATVTALASRMVGTSSSMGDFFPRSSSGCRQWAEHTKRCLPTTGATPISSSCCGRF
ncbi:hypothetical protein [Mesorhizobium sp.]|uniref:hypothetical protein n=1 Tax=Mesorhizobium sp. TaxID=1871066 RepID=UPI0025FB9607|nr:hypothetical protein [Mesorhizobium sp.]